MIESSAQNWKSYKIDFYGLNIIAKQVLKIIYFTNMALAACKNQQPTPEKYALVLSIG